MTKAVYVGAENPLPSIYTRLAYIQSSGTQFIDTGYVPPSNNLRIICDYEWTQPTASMSPYGVQYNGAFSIIPHMTDASTQGVYVGNSNNLLPFTVSANQRYLLDLRASHNVLTQILNGVKTTTAYTGTLNATGNLFIFAQNVNGAAFAPLSFMRLYSMKIYINDVLIRNFMPCKNLSGTIGLYEIVSGVFLTNAGSGTFVAGPTIETGGSVARKSKEIDLGINKVTRNIKSGHIGVGAIARQFWNTGNTLGNLEVGTIVYMNSRGVPTEFIVIHQGLPSSAYDNSCDGTWLLRKDLQGSWTRGSTNNYAYSAHIHMNDIQLSLFDVDIVDSIKSVKIPYWNGDGIGGSLATGANGLQTRLFSLSCSELGYSPDLSPAEGAVLDYFNGAAQNDFIAYLSNTAYEWCLRSPDLSNTTHNWTITETGYISRRQTIMARGIRPACIMPYDMRIDEYFNVKA